MPGSPLSRRRFVQACGGAALLSRGVAWAQPAPLTARQIVERIRAELNVPWNEETYRDTFKLGDPDTPVEGIATTFMSTLDVLQRARRAGTNLIITHEPTFWSDGDVTAGLEGDPVYRGKVAFAEENRLVVWRFHDHWHRRRPDGIMVGWNRQLGWERYQAPDNQRLYLLPPTTLERAAIEVARNLESASVRVVGDPNLPVSRIARGSHTLAGNIANLRDVDAILVSEAREWDSIEYLRDTVLSGQNKGMILIAHERGEEAGMDECARWLRTFVQEVPVEFIDSGEPFWIPS